MIQQALRVRPVLLEGEVSVAWNVALTNTSTRARTFEIHVGDMLHRHDTFKILRIRCRKSFCQTLGKHPSRLAAGVGERVRAYRPTPCVVRGRLEVWPRATRRGQKTMVCTPRRLRIEKRAQERRAGTTSLSGRRMRVMVQPPDQGAQHRLFRPIIMIICAVVYTT